MALSTTPITLKTILDRIGANVLADALRILGFGALIRSLTTTLRRKAPAADTTQLSTLQSVKLSLDAKAATLLRAYARAGTGTKGELTLSAAGATPGATHAAIAPNGDIVFLAADAYTDVDVVYIPEKCDAVALDSQPVASNTATLPASVTTPGAVLLMSCHGDAGTLTGDFIVLAPGSSPSSGQCALSTDKKTIAFASADAVTKASFVLGVASSVDVDAVLSAQSTLL